MNIKGLIFFACIGFSVASCNLITQPTQKHEEEGKNKFAADENFFLQRSYPDTTFQLKAYHEALKIAQEHYLMNKPLPGQRSGNPLVWETEGPVNIGGRINTIAVDPTNPNIIYVGNACGGVFKTTNAGATWNPIFDDQPYLAIGDIEIDPTNPNIVYVATGDPNISGFPFLGDGIYKSTDAGQTWNNIGLTDQRIISHVKIHPLNPDLIYAAAIGLPFQKNNERGLYKSTNGGQSWQQVYFASDSAGVIDLILHPTDTNVVYISTWNRIRNNIKNLNWGPDCLILKSTNAGNSWQPVMNGIPNVGILSRISIEMSGSNPNLLYAAVIDSTYDVQGIYKTTNGGQNWTTMATNGLPTDVFAGFGWYFDQLKLNPADDNELFVLGVDLFRSTDGGNSFNMAGPPWYTYDFHADKHDLIFEGNTIYCATDGGLYASTNHGDNWVDIENIPNTQFYHVAINPHTSGLYFGGAQDNGTCSGNKATINQWQRVFGGDGFDIQFHPTVPNIFYVETQNGDIWTTDDGGLYIYDAIDGIDHGDRRNWDMPYLLSNFNANNLYTGTYRLYKSTAGNFPYWRPISNDLTKGPLGEANKNTISVIEESKLINGTLFCGTSDGKVWRTTNDGNTYTDITPGLPNRYATDIEVSSLSANLVIVSHSGYKDNDYVPHIHLSRNNGNNWIDISGNLPPLAINEVELSSLNDSLIFVATDGGVYYTINQGTHWERLGNNMPVMVIYDIKIDAINQKLIAGTHARSIMSIPIDSINANLYVAPIVVSVSGDDSICSGTSATLTATGGGFVNWSPTTGLSCTACATTTATPSVTTTYYANVSNGSASGTDSITVVVVPKPTTPTIQIFNDSLVITNPDPLATSYQWFLGNTPIAGANSVSYRATQDGSYRVAASIGNCRTSSTAVYVSIIGTPTLAGSQTPKLWAFNGVVYANAMGSSSLHTFELYNMAGELMVVEQFSSYYQKDISHLASGNYIGRIHTDNGMVVAKFYVE